MPDEGHGYGTRKSSETGLCKIKLNFITAIHMAATLKYPVLIPFSRLIKSAELKLQIFYCISPWLELSNLKHKHNLVLHPRYCHGLIFLSGVNLHENLQKLVHSYTYMIISILELWDDDEKWKRKQSIFCFSSYSPMRKLYKLKISLTTTT